MTQGQRALAFGAATAALLLVLAVLGPKLLGLAAGPEVDIITDLKLLERRGFTVPLRFGTLHSTALQYQRLNVTLQDGDAERATLTATLDFEGNIERAQSPFRTKVSSLGLERVDYRHVGTEWVAQGSTSERLRAILETLEARRRALEAGDGGVAHRTVRVDAWYIRSEREVVLVSEDWQLDEDRQDRPVSEKGTTRFELTEADGGFFERR